MTRALAPPGLGVLDEGPGTQGEPDGKAQSDTWCRRGAGLHADHLVDYASV